MSGETSCLPRIELGAISRIESTSGELRQLGAPEALGEAPPGSQRRRFS